MIIFSSIYFPANKIILVFFSVEENSIVFLDHISITGLSVDEDLG